MILTKILLMTAFPPLRFCYPASDPQKGAKNPGRKTYISNNRNFCFISEFRFTGHGFYSKFPLTANVGNFILFGLKRMVNVCEKI